MKWLVLAAAALAATFLDPGLTLPRPRHDHVVVFDVTQSMNVQDMQSGGQSVSRLAFAKQALREALQDMPCGSRLGLAIFTEYRSYLLLAPVEVCANRTELRATLERIDGRMAWSGNSEIAKGLHSALTIVRQLPDKPAVVFVTDGQEAPPLNLRHRPSFDDKAGELGGLIVGVGGVKPQPIPKTDPNGRPIGYWSADEVLQTDPRSQGRSGSVGGESMAEEGDAAASPVAALGAAPGSEHLSALREPYLRLLAGELGLGFLRLEDAPGLSAALRAPAFARPVPVRADGRLPLAALALVFVLMHMAGPRLRTLRAQRSARRGAAER